MYQASLCGAALWLMALPAWAGSPTVIPIERVEGAYVTPHQRIEVEPGRRMNLYCEGSGEPTVIFESGLSDWSNTWALIQPAVATRTRACSYDRPGMGYSDPSPHLPTPEVAVSDLHRLLQKAGIEGPLLLVGHSLGGFYMKLFAVSYPDRVAGVVLVDPSEERLWPRVWPRLLPRFGRMLLRDAEADDADSIRTGIAHFLECAALAEKGPLEGESYSRCSDPVRAPLGAMINEERRKLQPLLPYQQAQAREFAHSMFAQDAKRDARYAKLFNRLYPLGNRPLIVLTHSVWDMTPPFGETGWQSWLVAHKLTATLSKRGSQRVVPTTRHNIQVDAPQAVIDAVVEVLDTLGGNGGGQADPVQAS